MTRAVKVLIGLFLVVAASLAALRWAPPAATGGTGDVQEIVLVARDMAFHVQDIGGVPNPRIRLRAGSRVRVILRNEERGVTHSFAIPAWDVDTGTFDAPNTGLVEFRVPYATGLLDYECTPHARMMRGIIEVH